MARSVAQNCIKECHSLRTAVRFRFLQLLVSPVMTKLIFSKSKPRLKAIPSRFITQISRISIIILIVEENVFCVLHSAGILIAIWVLVLEIEGDLCRFQCRKWSRAHPANNQSNYGKSAQPQNCLLLGLLQNAVLGRVRHWKGKTGSNQGSRSCFHLAWEGQWSRNHCESWQAFELELSCLQCIGCKEITGHSTMGVLDFEIGAWGNGSVDMACYINMERRKHHICSGFHSHLKTYSLLNRWETILV